MSGVRRTRSITCQTCGSSGVLKLGMAMINAVEISKEFACAGCGSSVRVTAHRAILALDWEATPVRAAADHAEQLRL